LTMARKPTSGRYTVIGQLRGIALSELVSRPVAASVDSVPEGSPGDARGQGDVAQLVEHLLCKQGVGGSSPLVSTPDHCERMSNEPKLAECRPV
jgi:hypothetical protein